MSERLLLGACFAMDMLGPATRKKLFGGYTVSALTVVFGSVSAFQKAAVLGYARAGQYERLCCLIAEPGGESSVAELTRTVAKTQWDTYGANSKSLVQYILRAEFPKVNFGDLALLKTMSRRQMRLGETFNGLGISAANGMGFGAAFPNEFRTMWEHSYEHPDPAVWARAVEAGVDIPATPERLSLQEAIQTVLGETAEYAREHFPHLVAELKLSADR